MVRIVRSLILQYQYVVRLLWSFGSTKDGTGRQFFHRFLMMRENKTQNFTKSISFFVGGGGSVQKGKKTKRRERIKGRLVAQQQSRHRPIRWVIPKRENSSVPKSTGLSLSLCIRRPISFVISPFFFAFLSLLSLSLQKVAVLFSFYSKREEETGQHLKKKKKKKKKTFIGWMTRVTWTLLSVAKRRNEPIIWSCLW